MKTHIKSLNAIFVVSSIGIASLFISGCAISQQTTPCGMSNSEASTTADKLDELALAPAIVNENPNGNEKLGRTPFQGISSIATSASGGRVFLVWYGNGKTENADNYLMVSYGDKSAKNWSDVKLTIKSPHCGSVRLFDPAAWRAPDGSIWIFWAQSSGKYEATGKNPVKVNGGNWDRRGGVWYVRCENPDAESPQWSAPRRICDGVMLNKPTVLQNGYWLFPVAIFQSDAVNDALSLREGAGVVKTSDKGKTFAWINTVKIEEGLFPEHMFVERKNGEIVLYARSHPNRMIYRFDKKGELRPVSFGNSGIMEAVSKDGGVTFSKPRISRIPASGTRFHISRLNSGRLLLVINDANNSEWLAGKPRSEADMKKFGREKMLAYLSDDDGKNWRGGLLLDERKGVSYPDASQSGDGSIYITYDRDRYTEQEILVAKISETDILAGKLVDKKSLLKKIANKGGIHFKNIDQNKGISENDN